MKFSERLGKHLIRFFTLVELNGFIHTILIYLKIRDGRQIVIAFPAYDAFPAIFSSRTRRYSIITVFIMGILVLVSWYIKVPAQAYGLTLDIIGAAIVARGLFRGLYGLQVSGEGGPIKTSVYEENEMTQLGPSPLEQEVAATVDGILGTSILVCGFIIQILSLL